MKRARGFTLIEVLIAATILFVAIAVTADTYRSALGASRRAARTVRLLTPLPLIVAAVGATLRDQPAETREGEDDVLGVHYRFEAKTVRFAPPPRRFDPDQTEFRDYPRRYRLYDVTLTLSADGVERVYLYQEVAWLPAPN